MDDPSPLSLRRLRVEGGRILSTSKERSAVESRAQRMPLSDSCGWWCCTERSLPSTCSW